MNRIVAFYQSSIGKKITMSLTGLFLCVFLVEHLIGNLLLLKGDEGATYDAFSAFMVGNPVIRFIEIFLFLSLIGHAISGFTVWRQNKAARPEKYEAYRLKENAPLWSRVTMLTGSFIFIFLVLHLRTFFVPMRLGAEHPSGFYLVREAFSNGAYAFVYVVAMILLAYHLRHGFQAGMQTLGLRNKKYTGVIDLLGIIFWLIIPLGFMIIPIYFYFFDNAATSTMAMGVHLP